MENKPFPPEEAPLDFPLPLRNQIMDYAWGSRTAIARLLGAPAPSGKPQAELWMGAHPKAPSKVFVNGKWISLADLIQRKGESVLGPAVARAFSFRMPFLFKVLAAEKPLSLQAHPDAQKAKEGFERENALDIPLHAPHRNYRDDNPKPEFLCALGPFWALCGFRKVSEILNLGRRFVSNALKQELQDLQNHPGPSGLKAFFRALMTLDEPRKKAVIEEALSAEKAGAHEAPVLQWIRALAREYPMDIGVISPVFLNLLHLMPGEGIFLPPGVLHAYLEGVGVELMANSDNVLRGGLTQKHVDLEALMDVLAFREYQASVSKPVPTGSCERRFEIPVDAFCLSRIDVSKGTPCRVDHRSGFDILLCVKGSGSIKTAQQNGETPFRRGASFLIPASLPAYRIEGEATFYRAFVPG